MGGGNGGGVPHMASRSPLQSFGASLGIHQNQQGGYHQAIGHTGGIGAPQQRMFPQPQQQPGGYTPYGGPNGGSQGGAGDVSEGSMLHGSIATMQPQSGGSRGGNPAESLWGESSGAGSQQPQGGYFNDTAVLSTHSSYGDVSDVRAGSGFGQQQQQQLRHLGHFNSYSSAQQQLQLSGKEFAGDRGQIGSVEGGSSGYESGSATQSNFYGTSSAGGGGDDAHHEVAYQLSAVGAPSPALRGSADA